ncbi:hypothetical protein Phi10:1_gp064 [Cellulophaga phage phi10:1]|uniref:Uncharacterized protein n=1 Tax=Cellulophaga phage phi10:1 TaxID=1327981 RepID=S0A0R6_9CAUD|nr:hypothetical protein Phi10:1_gp064 [Cellulophaga phage phi10:1]AGO48405.1 hypothetical protein Phi10:1_gp064 [Cellulophaga phage phi10:1]
MKDKEIKYRIASIIASRQMTPKGINDATENIHEFVGLILKGQLYDFADYWNGEGWHAEDILNSDVDRFLKDNTI